MPKYTFRCTQCGWSTDQYAYVPIGNPIDFPCEMCGGVMRRVASSSFGITKSFEPHYNHSVGHHVNSMREFKDSLKRASEDAFLQTGGDHNFEAVDPADARATATEEGLESGRKARRDQGIELPKGTIIT